MSALAEIICSEMARSGPIPFRRFMELALYEPAHGYYAGGRAAIGRHGDYVTSVSVGPLFGRLLAGQFEAVWRLMGQPAPFTVVEQGANTGDFAHDVLSAADAFPEFYGALCYRILEPFAANERRQRERLAAWSDKTAWHASPDDLPRFTGIHFSNELIDAMPVHGLVFRGGDWRERYVKFAENAQRFVWAEGPLSSPALETFLPFLPPVEGYETEVNLAAVDWIKTISTKLERGMILAADYGFARRDYYLPERKTGTLTAYRGQRRIEDLLADPGEQDLTAHVDFTTLADTARETGLRLAGFTDQHHFMVALGSRAFPDTETPLTQTQQRERRAFASLMHPGLMGRGFQFLALTRDLPDALPGFEFAGDPRAALGIA